MAKECKAPSRFLTCADRGEKDVAHASGSIGDFLEINAGFVWVEVVGVRVYSCYFSPNDPLEIFEIHGDPSGSLQLLSAAGEVLRRLEEAEVGPA